MRPKAALRMRIGQSSQRPISKFPERHSREFISACREFSGENRGA
jgi:hypothetical protein